MIKEKEFFDRITPQEHSDIKSSNQDCPLSSSIVIADIVERYSCLDSFVFNMLKVKNSKIFRPRFSSS